jgi:signal peptidase I
LSLLQKIFKILFWAFIVWLFVRTFIFQTFRIPSASMHGTLYEGDFVLVNKLIYGPRLPITPLSFKIGDEDRFVDWIQIPYFRLFGYGKIKRNDVLAFNYPLNFDQPIDIGEEHIKRCIALPGDSLKILNGDVYINSVKTKEPADLYFDHKVSTNGTIDSIILKRFSIEKVIVSQDGTFFNLFMSRKQADSLSKQKNITSVSINFFPKEYYRPSVYPNFPSLPWNYDFFGPLWIPHGGDSILLNATNISLYQRLIEKNEKVVLTQKGDSVFINKKYALYYTFKQNYYFVMGDNRHDSKDSREWGFVPESHIIGKATMVLYSNLKKGRSFLKIE